MGANGCAGIPIKTVLFQFANKVLDKNRDAKGLARRGHNHGKGAHEHDDPAIIEGNPCNEPAILTKRGTRVQEVGLNHRSL